MRTPRLRSRIIHSQEQSKGVRMSAAGHSTLPVAVIGGGPVGLAAASHLVTRGLPVKLYEAGETVAAHVRDWGHVRLFSPWGFNTDTAATAILREHGWQAPPQPRCQPVMIFTPHIYSRLARALYSAR